MCIGAAVLHRVSRIVYACPDPQGGAAALDPSGLGRWYTKRWPRIERGPRRDDAYALLVAYMAGRDEASWSRKLQRFERMRATW